MSGGEVWRESHQSAFIDACAPPLASAAWKLSGFGPGNGSFRLESRFGAVWRPANRQIQPFQARRYCPESVRDDAFRISEALLAASYCVSEFETRDRLRGAIGIRAE